jgi:hypothetical protein
MDPLESMSSDFTLALTDDLQAASATPMQASSDQNEEVLVSTTSLRTLGGLKAQLDRNAGHETEVLDSEGSCLSSGVKEVTATSVQLESTDLNPDSTSAGNLPRLTCTSNSQLTRREVKEVLRLEISEFSNSDDQTCRTAFGPSVADYEELQSLAANIQAMRYAKNRSVYQPVALIRLGPVTYEDLSGKEKTFDTLLEQIAEFEKRGTGSKECATDTFVDYLLRDVGLADFPFLLQVKPQYTYEERNRSIKPVFDFSVAIPELNMVLLVVEDKLVKQNERGIFKISATEGENQIAGEMVAAGWYNRCSFGGDGPHEVLAMRVIGTQFTFYHTSFPGKYIQCLMDGGTPSKLADELNSCNLLPVQIKKTKTLDFIDSEGRIHILEFLHNIRLKGISHVESARLAKAQAGTSRHKHAQAGTNV